MAEPPKKFNNEEKFFPCCVVLFALIATGFGVHPFCWSGTWTGDLDIRTGIGLTCKCLFCSGRGGT